jgi:hypothetical protein
MFFASAVSCESSNRVRGSAILGAAEALFRDSFAGQSTTPPQSWVSKSLLSIFEDDVVEVSEGFEGCDG